MLTSPIATKIMGLNGNASVFFTNYFAQMDFNDRTEVEAA